MANRWNLLFKHSQWQRKMAHIACGSGCIIITSAWVYFFEKSFRVLQNRLRLIVRAHWRDKTIRNAINRFSPLGEIRRLCRRLVTFYSIGLIIFSMKAISSEERLYFAYNCCSISGLHKIRIRC